MLLHPPTDSNLIMSKTKKVLTLLNLCIALSLSLSKSTIGPGYPVSSYLICMVWGKPPHQRVNPHGVPFINIFDWTIFKLWYLSLNILTIFVMIFIGDHITQYWSPIKPLYIYLCWIKLLLFAHICKCSLSPIKLIYLTHMG